MTPIDALIEDPSEAVVEMNVTITFKLKVEAYHFVSEFEEDGTPLTPRNVAAAMAGNIPHDIADICGPMSDVVVLTEAIPSPASPVPDDKDL